MAIEGKVNVSISKDAVSHSVPPMTQAEESYKQALTNIREIINRANGDKRHKSSDEQNQIDLKAYDTIVAMMDAAGF